MTATQYALVRIRSEGRTHLSTHQAATRCQVHPELIERFVQLGLCDPLAWDEAAQEWVFASDVVPLVRRILRLRRDLGINYAGIGVVLELLARIERLEREQALRDRRDRP